jgi:hypothetical protein
VTKTQVGNGLAKVLGIKLESSTKDDLTTRGESVFSVTSADTYVEEEPTIGDWFAEYTPGPRDLGRYVYNLFPFIHWLGRYNLQWLYGDLVAGRLSSSLPRIVLTSQVSLSAQSSCRRAWLMPNLRYSQSNSASTHPSWAC